MLASLKSLNKYLLKYKWRLSLGVLFVVISNLFAVLSPSIVRNLLDEVQVAYTKYSKLTNAVEKDILESEVVHALMIGGLTLIAYAILKGIFMFFMRQTIIVMSRHIEYDQKNEIYEKYQNLSTSFLKSHKVGDLMSRISEDVSRVRMYIGPAIMYGFNLIALTIFCIINMIRVSPSLTFYVLLPLPFLAISIYYVNKIVNKKSELIQSNLSNVTSKAQETYSGIRVIKSFNQEEATIKSFGNISETYKKSNINLALTEAFFGPSMAFFTGLSVLLTIFIGGYQAIEGNITIGNIAEFVMYISMLTFPFSAIGFTANMIQRAAVSQRRINEFLDEPIEIKNAENPLFHNVLGDIEFKNVSFTYPHTGIEALKNLNISIKRGQKVAIMGKTGSGKSTILHLLLRMYDVTSGEILIDGTNIKELDLTHLRKQINYVPQEVFLFSDTIANNIALSGNFDMDRVVAAATAADVHKDIIGLANGYDTVTGERGVMLSGGQKQRISIARALYNTPNLLIMDDSLSAVDSKTERTIQKNLSDLLEGKTVINVAHRIFKNWNFDQIIILENGKVLEQGTHDDLMNINGYYAKTYLYQTEETA